MLRHIIIKLLKIKNKENFKATGENDKLPIEKQVIELTADFLFRNHRAMQTCSKRISKQSSSDRSEVIWEGKLGYQK